MKLTQLISTSNEDRISNNDVIYLGNWCRTDGYIIKDELVAKYHWDNRDKLEKDYNYLNNFYERILLELSKKLNQLHSKSYSENYWRITVGYWLLYYLSVNFERWENINSALEEFDKINFYQSLNIKHQPIPSTTREFMNLSSDVKWNHINYTKIIKFINDKKNLI